MSAQFTKMQLSFGVAFAVVASVCIKLATGYLPVEGQQGYDNGHVGKKGTSARYADHERNGDPSPSCTMEADYEISQNYIIRTKDSKANGANFIAALNVRTFDVCLEQCCLKDNCDTTIFVGEAYRSEETNCFLFMCRPEGRGGENRCLFTYHLGYISSMKKAVGGFQGYEPDPVVPVAVTTAIPVQQIATTAKPTLPPIVEPEPISNCPEGYFDCDSGQCINELYICNSVVDCDDGSDEYRCGPQEPPPAENTNSDDASPTDGLWNAWPYDYSSSVDDKVVIDNDLSFQNTNRNRPSYTASSKSRPHPKGHKLNGIANNAPAPPNSLPTSTTTLSSIHRAVVTQAPVPMDKDAIAAVQPDTAVTVMAPLNEAVSDGEVEDAGKAEDAGKVNDTNILKEEGDENTDEMMYESRGGSGMPPASSAILPLVIGLIITVCLLLMVGCRLRFMNQRLRYGRLKTSAHDADYLINGMYL